MKREKAYVDARRKSILELLRENPTVRVDELAKRMGVSLITIRRDLQYLEEQKLLVRFYGAPRWQTGRLRRKMKCRCTVS